jgi:hypothetical protein
LKSFFEKKEDFKNVIFYFSFKLMQALLANEWISKVFIKCALFKLRIESESQLLFYKRLSYYFQRIGFKNQTLCYFMQAKLFDSINKFY